MSADGYLTITEARQRLREATRVVVELEAEYRRAVERSADAEAVYRAQVAEAFKKHRADGKAVSEADTLARADVAVLSRERDYSAGMLKLAGERLENARDSRRSLWRLIQWSAAHDSAAPTDERAPGPTWP